MKEFAKMRDLRQAILDGINSVRVQIKMDAAKAAELEEAITHDIRGVVGGTTVYIRKQRGKREPVLLAIHSVLKAVMPLEFKSWLLLEQSIEATVRRAVGGKKIGIALYDERLIPEALRSEIRCRLVSDQGPSRIAKLCGVSRSTVWRIYKDCERNDIFDIDDVIVTHDFDLDHPSPLVHPAPVAAPCSDRAWQPGNTGGESRQHSVSGGFRASGTAVSMGGPDGRAAKPCRLPVSGLPTRSVRPPSFGSGGGRVSHAKQEPKMSTITSVTPAVSLVDGRPVTTSQNIAEVFGKPHDDVLRRIRTLKCSAEFNARNFAAVEYRDAKGETRPAYRITRDGCAFLVMGFTGRRAAAFKEAYIDAFNRMEAELRSKAAAEPAHLPLAGTRWLISHDGKAQPSMQPVASHAVVIDPASPGDIRTLLQEMVPLDVLGHALQVAAHRLTAVATAERSARMRQIDPSPIKRGGVLQQAQRA